MGCFVDYVELPVAVPPALTTQFSIENLVSTFRSNPKFLILQSLTRPYALSYARNKPLSLAAKYSWDDWFATVDDEVDVHVYKTTRPDVE